MTALSLAAVGEPPAGSAPLTATQRPAGQGPAPRATRPATVGGDVHRWKRLRWGVRGALLVGVAASVAANMLHARPNPISQAIAAWPPLALLLTVELISRVPVYRNSLATIRLLTTTVIAGIAAWVSYWHMTAVAARYGETAASPYLLPLSVDGLVVVASICLVEITGRIQADHDRHLAAPTRPAAGEPAPTTHPLNEPQGIAAPPPATSASRQPDVVQPADRLASHGADRAEAVDTAQPPAPRRPTELAAPLGASTRRKRDEISVSVASAHGTPTPSGLDEAAHDPAHENTPRAPTEAGDRSRLQQTLLSADNPGAVTGTVATAGWTGPPGEAKNPRAVEAHTPDDDLPVPPGTAAAVAYWCQRDPGLHPAQIAARIGRSERTVRRHLRMPTRATDAPPTAALPARQHAGHIGGGSDGPGSPPQPAPAETALRGACRGWLVAHGEQASRRHDLTDGAPQPADPAGTRTVPH